MAYLLTASRAEDSAGEGEAERFTEIVSQYTSSLRRTADVAILTASSREAEERCSALEPDIGRALSSAAGMGVFPANAVLDREAFLAAETARGAAQSSAVFARSARGDAGYTDLAARMRSAGAEIARLAQGGATPDEFQAAVARRDEAEKELVALARALGSSCGLQEIDLPTLAAKVPERGAIVAYRRYTRFLLQPGSTIPNESICLCAFVVRPASKSAIGWPLKRIELILLRRYKRP